MTGRRFLAPADAACIIRRMRWLWTTAALLCFSSCSFFGTIFFGAGGALLQSKDVLSKVNTATPEAPNFPELHEDIASDVHDGLADAYFHPDWAEHVLGASNAVDELLEALVCIDKNPFDADAQRGCLESLYTDLHLAPPPKVPTTPIDPSTQKQWRSEMDVVRLQVNLRDTLGQVLVRYKTTQLAPISKEEIELRTGIGQGLTRVVSYLKHRRIQRLPKRPITTWVMGGGAANGAYSAGAAWWLLHQLDRCKTDAEKRIQACMARHCPTEEQRRIADSCLEDRVDIVAGASTGSLIGILTKDYFVGGEDRRAHALRLLEDSYGCKVNSDLYCTTSSSLLDLLQGHETGMMWFNGIVRLVKDNIDAKTFRSRTEYFASTVDLRSGLVHQLSSEDPLDMASLQALHEAVIASVVEPAMSRPVGSVNRRPGFYIDGGVRSGLPLLAPLRRGAERAVVFVNAPIEPAPRGSGPNNAVDALFRSLDLFTHQTIVGELHDAENRAIAKQQHEALQCLDRLRFHDEGALTPAQRSIVWDHCEGLAESNVPPRVPAAEALASQQVHISAPVARPEESGVFRRAWLFEPHSIPEWLGKRGVDRKGLAAVGYEFNPEAMWKLFMFGAAVAQQRCTDVNAVMGWHLPANNPLGCADENELQRAIARTELRLRTQGCFLKRTDLKTCSDKDLEQP